MDLLPHPSHGLDGVEPLDIPFVADTPYIGDSFWDFPLTHGFGDRWTTLPAPRLASLAQSWLYFGAIAEFLGRPIDYGDFKRLRLGFVGDEHGDPERSSVTANPLYPLLDEWFRLRAERLNRHRPATPWRRRFATRTTLPTHTGTGSSTDDTSPELYHCATFLDKVFDLAEDFEQLSQGHIYPIPAIILSVKVLCITLSSILRDQVQHETGKPPVSWPRTLSRRPGTDKTCSLPSSQLLLDMFQQQIWCPFQVGKIVSTHNYAVVYHFTRLFRRFSPQLSHRRCSETECVASNITDLAAYQPKHTEPSCQCRPLSVRGDQIREIIRQGGVPLVRVTTSSRRKPSIKVVKMTPWTRFVAFSHVWSDTGLGNGRANSLPKCQLRRLQEYAYGADSGGEGELQLNGARRSHYFWIDTLCIPAGDAKDAARIQAINKVPLVFQVAQRVLIMDHSLLNISLATTERCEALARLSLSPWSSRCWTYLEASMSSRCEVQCADGTIDPFSDNQQDQSLVPFSSYQGTWSLQRLKPTTAMIRSIFEKSPASDPLLQPHPSDTTSIKQIKAAISTSLSRPLVKEFKSTFSNGIRRSGAKNERTENTDLCTLFVNIWNELSKRSTTLPDDKHIILASLLGFNTQPLMRLTDPRARMSAILSSMDGVPMSLFLGNLSKASTTPTSYPDSEKNWIPLYPSKQRLKIGSRYTNIRHDMTTGDFYFPNNRISRREVSTFIIRPGSERRGLELTGSGEFRIRDTSDLEAVYSVKIHRETGEEGTVEPPRGSDTAYCILIQNTSQASDRGGEGRHSQVGALFQIQRIFDADAEPRSSGRLRYDHSFMDLSLEPVSARTPTGAQIDFRTAEFKGIIGGTHFAASDLSLALNQQYERPGMTVRVVYECPVTVEPIEGRTGRGDVPFMFGFPGQYQEDAGPTVDDQVALDATPFPTTWQMVYGQEGTFLPQLTAHIPTYQESTATPPISTTFLLTAFDGLVAAGSVSFSLAICFTLLPLHILSPLASIAVILKLVLHSFSIIRIFITDDDDNSSSANNILHSQRGRKLTILGTPIKTIACDLLHLILVAIYTAARATSPIYRLNILDKVFIYWSFTGHTVNILMQVLVTRYFVIPTLWEQYLASFGQRDEIRQDQKTTSPDDAQDTVARGISPSRSETAHPPSDDDLAGGMLIPPWESHPHPHDRHYKQSLLEHEETHPPTGGLSRTIHPPNKEKSTPPWWSKWLALPKLNLTLNLGTGKEITKRGKGKKKPVRRGRRKLPPTESMVVEAPGTEYERSSWRSGDFLLGEEYYRQVGGGEGGRLTGWS